MRPASTFPIIKLSNSRVMESAKLYREKKAKLLVKKIVQVMRSAYSAYLDISNKFTKLQTAYSRERSGNERLTNRLEEVLEENRELWIVAADFGGIKAVVGSGQVNAVINWAKQQEQIEAEQKRAARRKHNREARWLVGIKKEYMFGKFYLILGWFDSIIPSLTVKTRRLL